MLPQVEQGVNHRAEYIKIAGNPQTELPDDEQQFQRNNTVRYHHEGDITVTAPTDQDDGTV